MTALTFFIDHRILSCRGFSGLLGLLKKKSQNHHHHAPCGMGSSFMSKTFFSGSIKVDLLICDIFVFRF